MTAGPTDLAHVFFPSAAPCQAEMHVNMNHGPSVRRDSVTRVCVRGKKFQLSRRLRVLGFFRDL